MSHTPSPDFHASRISAQNRAWAAGQPESDPLIYTQRTKEPLPVSTEPGWFDRVFGPDQQMAVLVIVGATVVVGVLMGLFFTCKLWLRA